ncbi:MAG: hypothetical protein K0S86_5721 [Geminicoccaceae bacterium]|nr:hypothetical protein [Geminicoccaceae bacterium]
MYRLRTRGRGPLSFLFMLAVLGACADTEQSVTAPPRTGASSLAAEDSASLKPAEGETIAITIHREATLYPEGGTKVVVHGVVQCARDGDIQVTAQLYQKDPGRGSNYTGGQGSYDLACTTSPKYWEAEIYTPGVPFTPGPALVHAYALDKSANVYTEATTRHVKLVPVGQ